MESPDAADPVALNGVEDLQKAVAGLILSAYRAGYEDGVRKGFPARRAKKGDARERVLALLGGGPKRPRDIYKALSTDERFEGASCTVRVALKRLLREGLARADAAGVIHAADDDVGSASPLEQRRRDPPREAELRLSDDGPWKTVWS